jgi:hypothetical protein
MYKANLSYFGQRLITGDYSRWEKELSKYTSWSTVHRSIPRLDTTPWQLHALSNYVYDLRRVDMAKQRMSIEWVRRVNALKRQGFDVHVTTDAEGVMIHIQKKPSKRLQAY